MGTRADDELLGARAGNTVNLRPIAAVPASFIWKKTG